MEYIIKAVSIGLSCLGFAMMFNLKRDKWFSIFIGSGFIWLIYLLVHYYIDSIFWSNAIVGAIASIYVNILAYVCKAPSTIFLIMMLIPLVPGRNLYYTMYYGLNDNTAGMLENFNIMVETATGVVVGIIAVFFVIDEYRSKKKNLMKL